MCSYSPFGLRGTPICRKTHMRTFDRRDADSNSRISSSENIVAQASSSTALFAHPPDCILLVGKTSSNTKTCRSKNHFTDSCTRLFLRRYLQHKPAQRPRLCPRRLARHPRRRTRCPRPLPLRHCICPLRPYRSRLPKKRIRTVIHLPRT